MTKVEKQLCDAAERCMRWGGQAISEETSRKYKFWRSRMDSAAVRLYWERCKAKGTKRETP